MKRSFFLTILIIGLLVQSCSSVRNLYWKNGPEYFNQKSRNGLFKTDYGDGYLVERYKIDGQTVIKIKYYKNEIISIEGSLPIYEENIIYTSFRNYYKRGKLVQSCQINLDSVNRFWDLETMNNGTLRIDSLYKVASEKERLEEEKRLKERDSL